MKYSVIIPARYDSSRLPGKPMVELNGVPMIIRTYRQCVKACPSENVYVATDDNRIKDLCVEYGIQVIMTSKNCLTGTDRVAECSKILDSDVYINVQGDEPVFNPDDLKILINKAKENPESILNGYCNIDEEVQFRNYSTPKVVFRPDGRLLYMSRSSIPINKKNQFKKGWRQVCAYSFPKQALKDFSSLNKKTNLEDIEDIEILRFLEIGWEVYMLELSNYSVAVDSPEDIVFAEKAISNLDSV